ncbi:hypothetical protein [Benzoatithermus flavus]|uniref:PH domain-containing protein n=1 Tax=Benzoatithermus flavus TaxID=3108223 RepID=A0ABU8XXI5_9PROT
MSIDRARQRPDSAPLALPKDAVELAYRKPSLLADYLRAIGGLVLTLLPLALFDPPWPVRLGLVALAALFTAFLVQTRQRHQTRLRLTPEGIARVGRPRQQVTWQELDHLRLRWFGPRRAGGNGGWLELELRGGSKRLVITSALDRFEDVLADAVDAAARKGLPLEPATRANVVAALGRVA